MEGCRRVNPDRRKRGGRPKVARDRRLNQTLAIRATTDEIDLFYRIASRQDTSATELLRAEVKRIIAASSSLLR